MFIILSFFVCCRGAIFVEKSEKLNKIAIAKNKTKC